MIDAKDFSRVTTALHGAKRIALILSGCGFPLHGSSLVSQLLDGGHAVIPVYRTLETELVPRFWTIARDGLLVRSPEGKSHQPEAGLFGAALDLALGELRDQFDHLSGIRIRRTRFEVSIDLTKVSPRRRGMVKRTAEEIALKMRELFRYSFDAGRISISPAPAWSRRAGIQWLLQNAVINSADLIVYLGSDAVDEEVARPLGGIFGLMTPAEAEQFAGWLALTMAVSHA